MQRNNVDDGHENQRSDAEYRGEVTKDIRLKDCDHQRPEGHVNPTLSSPIRYNTSTACERKPCAISIATVGPG